MSWQGYLLLLPLSILFAVTTIPSFQRQENLAFGVLVSIAAYGMAGIVLWIASVTVLRQRRSQPVSILLVALIGGLAWALRSAVFAGALEWAGLESTAALAQRLVFGFALGVLAVPVMAWIVASLAEFRHRREEALQRLVDEQVAADQQEAYVQVLRAGLVDQVSAALDQARIDVDALDLSAESMPRDTVEALERVSRDAVRRVSHETWQEGREASRVRLQDVIRVSASTKPFQPWILGLLVPFWIVAAARTLGWADALVVGLVGAAYLLGLVAAANVIVPRSGRRTLLSYWVAVAALGTVGLITDGLVTLVAPAEGGASYGLQVSILASVTAMFVIVLTGWGRAATVAGNQRIDALYASISAAEVRRESLAEQERRMRRQIAIALHGTVGANLTAATMRLHHAIDNGDVSAATEALVESRRLLDVDIHSLLLREHADVKAALNDLVDQWFGLVDITVDVDPDLRASPDVTQAVLDVVTEGISNAVGHGGATSVDVQVSRCADGVRLVLKDDGHPPVGGTPGLGSRMLDEHARGRWSRQNRDPRGSQLTIELPGGLIR